VISHALLGIALLVVALLLAGGVLLVLGHGVAVWLEEAAYGARMRAARAALADAIARGAPDDDTRSALRRLSHRRALALLEELAPSLAGPDAGTVREAAAAVGVLDRADRRCGARSWRKRVHAVRVLTALGGGEAVVPALLHDPRPEVRAAAAEWAADHPAEPVVERLVAMLAEDRAFMRSTVMDSLIRLRRDAVAPLARAIAQREGTTGPAALEVAARIASPALAEPAAARIADPDPRVRSWVARLLGALGGEEHAAAVVRLLDDPEPEVRAAAAVALGRLGHWPAAGAVAARLRDPAWRVRRDAALALRALGAPGELLLERALRDEDAFARDMARQTLDLPEAVLPA
jgi:hypothetical protein